MTFRASIILVFLMSYGSFAIGQESGGNRQNALNRLRYVDLKDLQKFGTELKGTSALIIRHMKSQPSLFVSRDRSSDWGVFSSPDPIRFSSAGPMGPSGRFEVDDQGRKVFETMDSRKATRNNAILGAEFEKIIEEKYDKTFRLRLNIFVHDRYHQSVYYFRRMWVRVDWTQPRGHRLEILRVVEDIPLAQTRFSVYGDILERKVVLQDERKGITKVFPIAVGAFDVRTAAGMDDVVRSMTHEFPNATLKRIPRGGDSPYAPNSRSRIWPSYYRGRPFIALYADGRRYRQIGLHYKITGHLIRGFVSHGCMRMRDQDLYQLDAILNEGVHRELKARFVYNLPEFRHVDHPMPKVNGSFSQVVYSDRSTDAVVKCRHSEYYVRRYGPYHTVADRDCLTLIKGREGSVQPIVHYLRGETRQRPRSLTGRMDHQNEIDLPEDEFSSEGNWFDSLFE